MTKNNKVFLDTGIRDLLHAFGNPKPPQVITQIPFDHDDCHYRKLCSLDPRYDEKPIDGIDFLDYALDLKYQELQPDLFLYVFPLCLNFWRNHLIHDSNYVGAVEEFLTAMIKHNGFHQLLTTNQYTETSKFVRNSIINKMSDENHISQASSYISTYSWIGAIANYGNIFPDLHTLWKDWWTSDKSGLIICKLQYASLFMYRKNENPIFPLWTPDKGGGPPIPWQTDSYIYDRPWLTTSIHFLTENLTSDNIEKNLKQAHGFFLNTCHEEIAQRLLQDFNDLRWFIDLRIEEFLDIISGNPAYIYDWQTQ